MANEMSKREATLYVMKEREWRYFVDKRLIAFEKKITELEMKIESQNSENQGLMKRHLEILNIMSDNISDIKKSIAHEV